MSEIIVLSGSPSVVSKTAALGEYVAGRLRGHGRLVRSIQVRELSPVGLFTADTTEPGIAEVINAIADADGIVVASPVYKAACSGLLKALLDLLPQFALAGKVVLPLVTGGTKAHVLAIDYSLRPVLTALGADHVVQGWFVLDSDIELGAQPVLASAARAPLDEVIDGFADALRRSIVDNTTAGNVA